MKDTSHKLLLILINLLPIFVMIIAIRVFDNDYVLVIFYLALICLAFAVKYQQKDIMFFTFGLVAMTISEYFFISVGVETFNRNSLFGIMPLWLPILWGYVFVVMKRVIRIIDEK